MTDNNQRKSTVTGAKNAIYSGLVFFLVACIGIAILDPAAIEKTNGPANIGPGSLIAVALACAATIFFSMWLSKRGK